MYANPPLFGEDSEVAVIADLRNNTICKLNGWDWKAGMRICGVHFDL